MAAVGVFVVVVRLIYLHDPVRRDEAGYLLVARSWSLAGPHLYGHYFVDRPPGLIALYRVAAATEWVQFVRVLALAAALVVVASAAWTARQVTGPRGAAWAAVVAGACVSTPAMGAEVANGEIFAAAFVMASIGLTVAAVRRTGSRSVLLACAAGTTAASALSIKQNFADGFVFATALGIGLTVHGQPGRRRLLVLALAWTTGAAWVLLSVVLYAAHTGLGIKGLWFTLIGVRAAMFRISASGHGPIAAPGVLLLGWGVVSGLLVCGLVLVRQGTRTRGAGRPIASAVVALFVFEVIGITAGGGAWTHYLVQGIPAMALAVGVWASSRAVRAVAIYTALSAVLTVVAVRATSFDEVGHGASVGTWLHASSDPDDTLVVLFENTEMQLSSGMRSPYDQLWILPARAMDPRLERLRALLASPDAPTWVVTAQDSPLWDVQSRHRLRRQLKERYHRVARVCGRAVWLRNGEHRALAASHDCR